MAGVGTAQSTQQANSALAVQLHIVVQQRAWVRVVVDDKVELDSRLLPGSAYQFSADNRIEILTGNGAALQVVYNQKDLGLLGTFGEVIDRIFTVEGVMTPTASITPTRPPKPSATSKPTITPTLTATPK